MAKPNRSSRRRNAALLAFLLLACAGCDRFRARVELKKGNNLYQEEEYREAITQFQRGLELDPTATFAWRSVGLAALAEYRPGDASPENMELADLAVNAFDKYLVDHPDDTRIEEFLLSVLLDAERFDEARTRLRQKFEANPSDASARAALIAVLIRSKSLDEAYELAKGGTPPDPNSLYSVGVAAWERLYVADATDVGQREHLLDLGLQSLDEALRVKPDFAEAMVYINLLYRQKALFELQPRAQQEAMAKAQEWFDKATKLREEQAAALAAQATEAATEDPNASHDGGHD